MEDFGYCQSGIYAWGFNRIVICKCLQRDRFSMWRGMIEAGGLNIVIEFG